MASRDSDKDIPFTRESALSTLSRRGLLAMVAAGGTAAVAGCGGGGGGDDGTTTTTTDVTTESGGGTTTASGEEGPDRQQTDIYAIQGQEVAIEQAQMNTWNQKTGWTPPWHGTPPPMHGIDYGLYFGGLIASYDYANEGATLKLGPLNGPFRYPDGREFDHQLVVDNQKYIWEAFLQVANGTYDRSIFNYKNLRLEEDAVALDFKQGGNPTLNRLQAMPKESGNGLTSSLETHPELHAEFLERAREATSSAEKQTVIQGLLTHEIPIEEGIRKMGTEPGEVTSLTRSMVVVGYREPYATDEFPWGYNSHLNPDTPWYREEWAGKPNLAGYISIPFVEDAEDVSRNTILNAAIAGKIDSIDDIRDPTVVEQFPEGWRLLPGLPEEAYVVGFSPGGQLGANDEQARALRQAIAYLLDPDEFSKVAHYPPPAHKVSGIPYPAMERRWLGSIPQYNDTFTNYGSSGTGWVQQERAYEKLREGGLEQRDGVWYWADSGERFTLRFVYQTGAEPKITGHASNVEEQLQRHGITMDVNNVQGSTMTTLVATEDGRGEWDLGLLPGNMDTVPHPWFGFRASCGLGSFDLAENTDFGASDFRNGYGQVEVPMPVGDPEGDLQTVDYDRLVRRLPQVGSAAEEAEIVRTLAWTINQWVPMVAVALHPDPNALDARKFSPKIPLDHAAWAFGLDRLILTGVVDVNPEYVPSVTPQEGTKIGLD